jgi:transcriptional regulator with XRE-family HTH domain
MSTKPVARTPLEEALGAAFRAARRANKVSLTAMAQKLGCSINTVRWHEAGARSLRADDLVRAADIIGVDATVLLANQGEAPRNRAAKQSAKS